MEILYLVMLPVLSVQRLERHMTRFGMMFRFVEFAISVIPSLSNVTFLSVISLFRL